MTDIIACTVNQHNIVFALSNGYELVTKKTPKELAWWKSTRSAIINDTSTGQYRFANHQVDDGRFAIMHPIYGVQYCYYSYAMLPVVDYIIDKLEHPDESKPFPTTWRDHKVIQSVQSRMFEEDSLTFYFDDNELIVYIDLHVFDIWKDTKPAIYRGCHDRLAVLHDDPSTLDYRDGMFHLNGKTYHPLQFMGVVKKVIADLQRIIKLRYGDEASIKRHLMEKRIKSARSCVQD